MQHHQPVAAALAVLLASVVAAAEGDWPQWRGPNRDGVSTETGLLREWPREGPKLVWKANSLGSGYSSVAVVGNRIFTLGNKGNKSHLVCLDRADGKQQWSVPLGEAGNDLGCTPTVANDLVYAIGQAGDLVCATADKGEVKWRKNLKTDFKGNHGGWRYTESPLVDGERLICTPGAADAQLVALDRKTGAVIWKSKSPFEDATAAYSSVVIAELDGIRMYVQLTAAGVVGVESKSGKVLWRHERLAGTTANIPTPIVLPNHQLFVCAGYNQGGALLTLTFTDGKMKVKEEYFNGELKNKHGGVLVVDGRVYGDSNDSGFPFCAEVKTGKLIWKKKDRSPGGGSAAITYADGRLYMLYDNGYMALVDAKAKEYTEVSGFKVPNPRGPSWAHPVVAGGKLYLRQADTLYCYDIKQP